MEVIKRSQKNSTKKSNRFHDFVQKNSCQEMLCPVSPDEPEELRFTGNIPRGVLLIRNEP